VKVTLARRRRGGCVCTLINRASDAEIEDGELSNLRGITERGNGRRDNSWKSRVRGRVPDAPKEAPSEPDYTSAKQSPGYGSSRAVSRQEDILFSNV